MVAHPPCRGAALRKDITMTAYPAESLPRCALDKIRFNNATRVFVKPEASWLSHFASEIRHCVVEYIIDNRAILSCEPPFERSKPAPHRVN